MTQFFKGKELPLSKKVFDQLANWVDRQRTRMATLNSEPDEDAGEAQTARSQASKHINPYAIRSCLEAIWFAYGHVTSPQMPSAALYRHIWQKEMTPLGVTVPKIMFTVFNGGKAMGSKVKFARFYVIMNLRVQDVGIDANIVYYKVAAAIKKAITSHKLGENGFKANVSGSYFNALDTVNDSFKLIEEAINSTGVNTNDRKVLTIGINADSQSSYIEEHNRYDIEGPKNLYDQTQLADYFVKMAQDHPLLAYIEDPFAEGDVVGYQKILRRFKDTQVKVAVKNWFGSDLDSIQEFTQMIQLDDEEEKEEEAIDEEEQKRLEQEEEEKRQKEEEEAAAAAADSKNAKGGKAAAEKKKGGQAEEVVDPELPDENDPNAQKFLPDLIHFDRAKHQSTEPFTNLVQYQMYLKDEEKFGLIYDDCTYDSKQGEIVDYAIANSLSYLNLKGLGKPERSSKVDRLQEILEELRNIQANSQLLAPSDSRQGTGVDSQKNLEEQ